MDCEPFDRGHTLTIDPMDCDECKIEAHSHKTG